MQTKSEETFLLILLNAIEKRLKNLKEGKPLNNFFDDLVNLAREYQQEDLEKVYFDFSAKIKNELYQKIKKEFTELIKGNNPEQVFAYLSYKYRLEPENIKTICKQEL